jgi:hypothetical protein
MIEYNDFIMAARVTSKVPKFSAHTWTWIRLTTTTRAIPSNEPVVLSGGWGVGMRERRIPKDARERIELGVNTVPIEYRPSAAHLIPGTQLSN